MMNHEYAGIRTEAMSKYVKELMMDQLRSDLDGSRSLLILDLKDLDAVAEHGLRRDLRKKSIRLRVLKNSLARRVFTDMGMDGLSKYLKGPSAIAWGGEGITELAKEIVGSGQDPQEARDQGRSGRGSGGRPGAGRRYHQAPQPRGLDRSGDRLCCSGRRGRRWRSCRRRRPRWSASSRPLPSGSKAKRAERPLPPPRPASRLTGPPSAG